MPAALRMNNMKKELGYGSISIPLIIFAFLFSFPYKHSVGDYLFEKMGLIKTGYFIPTGLTSVMICILAFYISSKHIDDKWARFGRIVSGVIIVYSVFGIIFTLLFFT